MCFESSTIVWRQYVPKVFLCACILAIRHDFKKKMVSYNLIFERIDQTLKIGILNNFLSIHKYNSNHYHVKVQSKLSIQLSMEKNYTFMPMHF